MTKIVVGLGNFGKKYEKNRHNVGFLVLDSLRNMIADSSPRVPNHLIKFRYSKKYQSEIIETDGLLLVKPQTMMNNSGTAVKKLTDFYKLKMEHLWIVHDDLDIILGDYKIQKEKGPKDHKGLNSIEESLGKSSFTRVRVGVDARDPNKRMPGEEYVLRDFSDEELDKMGLVIDKLVKELYDNLALSY